MPDEFRSGAGVVPFAMFDIRSLDARVLLRSPHAHDVVVALLAGGGRELVPQILSRIAQLPAPQRELAASQSLWIQ